MTTITFEKSEVMTLSGKEYMLIELNGFDEKVKARKFVSENKGKFVAEIKRYSRKRSLDANSYFWVLTGKLAALLKLTTTELYRGYITEIGDNYEIMPIKESAVSKFTEIWKSNGLGWVVDDLGKSKLKGYRNIKAYYGSSTYNEDQMQRLIDMVVQDCQIQGIETKTPKELQEMMEKWNAAEN